jgi:hypothetical protein
LGSRSLLADPRNKEMRRSVIFAVVPFIFILFAVAATDISTRKSNSVNGIVL